MRTASGRTPDTTPLRPGWPSPPSPGLPRPTRPLGSVSRGPPLLVPTLPGGPLPPPPSGSRKARPAVAPAKVGSASWGETTPRLPLSTPLGEGGSLIARLSVKVQGGPGFGTAVAPIAKAAFRRCGDGLAEPCRETVSLPPGHNWQTWLAAGGHASGRNPTRPATSRLSNDGGEERSSGQSLEAQWKGRAKGMSEKPTGSGHGRSGV